MRGKEMGKIRLDRFLAKTGAGTRSGAKAILRQGGVTVNGVSCRTGETKLDPDTDEVCLDGKRLYYAEYEYYLLNKGAGCVSATEDRLHPTVLDFIDSPRKRELFPVGRLDIDTEGLLLITNDGVLAHRLLSPSRHVDKTYYARVRGRLTDGDIRQFAEGLDIGEERPTMPAVLKILSAGEESEAEVTLQEGKFHQVKRMMEAVGKEVTYLRRIAFGGIVLEDSLPCGKARPLTEKELRMLSER